MLFFNENDFPFLRGEFLESTKLCPTTNQIPVSQFLLTGYNGYTGQDKDISFSVPQVAETTSKSIQCNTNGSSHTIAPQDDNTLSHANSNTNTLASQNNSNFNPSSFPSDSQTLLNDQSLASQSTQTIPLNQAEPVTSTNMSTSSLPVLQPQHQPPSQSTHPMVTRSKSGIFKPKLIPVCCVLKQNNLLQ